MSQSTRTAAAVAAGIAIGAIVASFAFVVTASLREDSASSAPALQATRVAASVGRPSDAAVVPRIEQPSGATAPPAKPPAVAAEQAATASPAESAPESDVPNLPRFAPVTPIYGAPVERTAPTNPAPLGRAAPIYRCRTARGLLYSNQTCADATVVDESSAVTGYDSKPSDRMARLVTSGRTVAAAVPRQVAPAARESPECSTMRRQLVDLDADASYAYSQRTLDEWRRIREDIRAGMTRLHC